jgi:transcriptional regulator with XRE-family HTH domain
MATGKKKISELLRARGMTEQQLERLTGINVSTFRRWEAGSQEPDPGKLISLAEALEVPLEQST